MPALENTMNPADLKAAAAQAADQANGFAVHEPAELDVPPGIVEPSRRLRVFLGVYHVVLAAAVVAALVGLTPTVESTSALPGARAGGLSRTTGLLVLALVGGVGGSLAHTAAIFGSRAGRHTLERSYTWWYILRPLQAAMLALVVMAAVNSGFSLTTGVPDTKTATAAILAGGLTGLFTDTVLQKLRALLGATSTELPASQQKQPLAASPVPKDGLTLTTPE